MDDSELRDLLTTGGRSQVWLARQLGVRPNSVWLWAHGRMPIPDSRAERIRALLDVRCPACGHERTA
jgi:DNA-binding transcriptional regulator YdaS (Cro superfamily)